ncbi:hypothetical protein KIN20_021373 [Parelaphostrongylus tenuis]|uniref:Uncharacterized protein n=1 Tax=Parelaphostrongylus tenuis TaxID=148309 RepID=A0AAD5QU59_PARTN|nr:hypothetical protein KIN20_021373 [Parelaphostrongylus tenuis]
MVFFTNIARSSIDLFMLSLLASMSVLGCGVLPAGQGSTRTFTVTGFSLPVAMAYSENSAVSTRFSGIATSEAGAKGFVERLVMQTVFDVLERQARNALLPDVVISTILGQLSVKINYMPLNCQMAVRPGEELKQMESGCIIVDNTVTGICNNMARAAGKKCPTDDMVKTTPVNATHLTISGTLSVRIIFNFENIRHARKKKSV